jgi:S-adenosylmethionine hydrolase
MRTIITLTTDFGYADPWVGVMKGVMLSINTELVIVDLAHGVPPQDIIGGALALADSSGRLEIACFAENAAQKLGAARGTPVEVVS